MQIDFLDFLFAIAVLIISVMLHEISHGYAAYFLGDSTAKYAGRLTLNPLKHLEIFGSIILPLMLAISHAGIIIGWAKPVPFNPYNLRSQKWGPALVGAAGPLSNLLIVCVFGIMATLVPLDAAVKLDVAVRTVTAFGFQHESLLISLFSFSIFIIFINLVLAVFNLIPIPPLDGSRILFSMLPYKWMKIQFFFEKWGIFLILLLLFIFRGVLEFIISFLLQIVMNLIL